MKRINTVVVGTFLPSKRAARQNQLVAELLKQEGCEVRAIVAKRMEFAAMVRVVMLTLSRLGLRSNLKTIAKKLRRNSVGSSDQRGASQSRREIEIIFVSSFNSRRCLDYLS